MKLTIAGKMVSVTARDAIGKGGEADIYALRDGCALKVFKAPTDPDYRGDPDAQEGARLRLIEQQDKLPAFPKGLPPEVMAPIDLARNGTGRILGYTMGYLKDHEVLLRYGDRRFREQGGIDPNDVLGIFETLRNLVQEIHTERVVIGDFNDLNVLVKNGIVKLIDADSYQFGKFVCRTFTARFLDPLHSDPKRLVLARPLTADADWYAYAVMLFQALLYVGPYGGVHRPKTGLRLQHDDRVLRRITVFDPAVIYPKPAIPYAVLPDEVLDYFHQTFEQDQRGVFDRQLLENMRWTTCGNCGTVHARPNCPMCATYVKREPVVVRGKVTARRVFATEGQIVCAVHQRGKLHYLYHDGSHFRREGDRVAVPGPLHPAFRYRISGDKTIIARQRRALFPDRHGQRDGTSLDVDAYGHLPVIDANSRAWYWVDPAGQLFHDDGGRLVKRIGEVLPGQTLFWVGEKFGFGFYRAGTLIRAFVFTDRGMNDQVGLVDFHGQLVDTTCVFSDARAWFFATLQDKGRLQNHVYVIDQSDGVLAHRYVEQTEDDWLAAGIRGRFAVGQSLYVPTAHGIVRIDEADLATPGQTFPDTESFVDETSYLLAGDGGIYVVGTHDITLLTIK